MSWGIRITILYGGFVILIVSMVMLTMRQKVDLVAKDYYQQELEYQQKIDKLNRTVGLGEQLSWSINRGQMILEFPPIFPDELKGASIYFLRPSDSGLDHTVIIDPDTSLVRTISTADFIKGVYRMHIDWYANDSAYYNEAIVTIN